MSGGPGTCDPMAAALRADPLRRWSRAALLVAVGVSGTLVVHYPMLGSGFRRIQTDLGDTRLLNYILEHGWLWANRSPGHERFWDAPFFHPMPNVVAYSDAMLSFAPPYWAFRLGGLGPESAFGAWLIFATALNYVAGVVLFHGGLGFGAPASAAASGLLAFGSPRVGQLGHAQLVPFVYPLIALYALCRVFRDEAAGPGERAACWIAFGLAMTAQLYGGVYIGWFTGVALVVAALAALAMRSTRDGFASILRRDWWAIGVGAAAGAALLGPFLSHYLSAAREFGSGFNDVQRYFHAAPLSWLSVGEESWAWGWFERRWPLVRSSYDWEHRLGVGPATTILCGAGLWLARRRPLARTALAVVLFGLATMTLVPGESVAMVAAAAACFGMGCLFREPDWTERGVPAFALAMAVLLWASPYNDLIRSLTLTLGVFCFARCVGHRDSLDRLLAPGLALALLAYHLLPGDSTALMAMFILPGAAILAHFLPARRAEVAAAAVGLWLSLASYLAFESRPWVLTGAALGATLGWEASGPARMRLRSGWIFKTFLVAFPLVTLLYGQNSLWLACSPWIPGSMAIRVPARVILILLVPAALGLAIVVQRLDRGRLGTAAWAVALACLLEQGRRTTTYDVAENHARIDSVVRNVDRSFEAFYYRPVVEETFVRYNLDAMWASLATGVPTVNGASGGFPRAWFPLPQADVVGKGTTEDALAEWCRATGIRRDRIQRIGRQPRDDPFSDPPK